MSYRILYVDDSKDDYKRISESIKSDFPNIKFDYCDNKKSAISKIRKNHYHIALIDVHLSNNEPPGVTDLSGIEILRLLKTTKPSCYRILTSNYLREYRQHVFDSLSPHDRLSLDIIDKRALRATLVADIGAIIRDKIGINDKLVISIDDSVYLTLKDKLNDMDIKLIKEELEFILKKGFSDYYLNNDKKVFIIKSLDIEEITGGRSSSVVLKVTPSMEGHKYNKVVIKVDKLDVALHEYDNYVRWVKWFKEYHNRTELLGFVSADTIAANIYSFAGGSKLDYFSLRQIVNNNKFQWDYNYYDKLISDIFNPSKQEFYSKQWISTGKSLKDYFYIKYYKGKFHNHSQNFEKWISHFEDINLADNGSKIKIKGSKIFNNPFSFISRPITLNEYHQCVCHGDMIDANIMANQDGKYVIIDFANTGIGPIELDFVSLEASVRLCFMKIDDIKMLIKFEKQLNLKETSNKNLKSDGFVKDENAICLKLIGRIRQLYALNFQEEFNFERYLLNCIFVSLKLIGISSLSGQQKLSLLAWAIASQEYIQILNERQAAQQPAIVC